VLPASGYVCWALQVLAALGAAAPALRDVRFVRVLDLATPRTCTLALTPDPLHTDDEAGGGGGGGVGAQLRGTIVITCAGRVHATMAYECAAAGRGGAPTALAGAHAAAAAEPAGVERDGSGAEEGGDDDDEEEEEEEFVREPYALFGEQGFEYGPDFAQLRHVRVRRGRRGARAAHAGARASAALAGAAPPRAAAAAAVDAADGAPLGPLCAGALDSALQLASFVDGAPISPLYLPYISPIARQLRRRRGGLPHPKPKPHPHPNLHPNYNPTLTLVLTLILTLSLA